MVRRGAAERSPQARTKAVPRATPVETPVPLKACAPRGIAMGPPAPGTSRRWRVMPAFPDRKRAMSSVIVVTGAAGALGTALARHLVASGHRVAGVGLRRHQERLRTLEQELGAA